MTQAFWILAAVALVWMIAAHSIRGARSEATVASQLRHPAQGPIGAMLPLMGMLQGMNLHQAWAVGGTILIVVSIVAAALFGSWIVTFWMRGVMTLESVHGAYFLPTVAASILAAGAASEIGATTLAAAAFAVGGFFWIVMFALVSARLAFRPPLPPPLTPTMAILMAPPAVAGLSWFLFNGGQLDAVEEGLLGIATFFLLMQLQFLRRYVRLAFSLGFWSFAFPSAFIAAFFITWLAKAPFDGSRLIGGAILAVVTRMIAAIGYLSIRLYKGSRQGPTVATPPETVMTGADNSIEPAIG